MILDELDFAMGQRSPVPTRAWLGRMALMGFGSVRAWFTAVVLMLAR